MLYSDKSQDIYITAYICPAFFNAIFDADAIQ